MPYLVVCDACSHRLKIPDSVWAKHVQGRATTLKCKGCSAPIHIDGTQAHEPIGGSISVMPAPRASTRPRAAEQPAPTAAADAQSPAPTKVEPKKPEPLSPAPTKVEPKKPEPLSPAPANITPRQKAAALSLSAAAPKKPPPPPAVAEPAAKPAPAVGIPKKPNPRPPTFAATKVTFSDSAHATRPKPFKSSAADWRVIEPGAIDDERPSTMRPKAPVWDRGAKADAVAIRSEQTMDPEAPTPRDGGSQPEIHQVAVDPQMLDSLAVRGEGPPRGRRRPMATLQGLAPPDAGVRIIHMPESEAETEPAPAVSDGLRARQREPHDQTTPKRAAPDRPAAEPVQVSPARTPPRRVRTGERFPAVMVAENAERRDSVADTENAQPAAASPSLAATDAPTSAAVAFVLRPLADSVAEIPKPVSARRATTSIPPTRSTGRGRVVIGVLALIAIVTVLLLWFR